MSYKRMVLKFFEFTIFSDMFAFDIVEENKKVIKEKYDDYIKTVLATFEPPLNEILEEYLKMEREEIEDQYRLSKARHFWQNNNEYMNRVMKGKISRHASYKRFPFEENLEKVRRYEDGF